MRTGNPLSVGQALARAFAAFDDGRPAEARRLARALQSQQPEPAGLAYLLGLLALADGQGRKAAQHLARAIDQPPLAAPPLLAMARAQVQQQRHDAARLAFRRLLAAFPGDAQGWREAAELCLSQENFTAAALLLRPAVRLNPASASLRNNLGIAERAAGRLNDAEAQFTAAILLDPGAARPYANLAGLRRHQKRPAAPVAARAVQIAPAIGAHHLEWGQSLDHGPAAIAAFRDAVALLPHQAEPLWLLAEALHQNRQTDEAAELYRQILARGEPDRFGAALALARLGGGERPTRADDAYVAALYDQYAGSFDEDLLTRLNYRGPALLADALSRLALPLPLDILDVGCGTGLAGQAVRALARRLDGVDLSAKMVDQARARGLYDDLTVGDLVTAMQARADSYDLILAADVLIYQGDLTPVGAAAALALRRSGHFAFTVEQSDIDPYHLTASGRFAHAEGHLRAVAVTAGLSVRLIETTVTRREAGKPVPGLLCVMQKP